MKRKSVTEDEGVKAAVKTVKAAMLTVNSDDEIVSLVTLAAIRKGQGLFLVSATETCLCAVCLKRIRDQFFEVMDGLIAKSVAQGPQHQDTDLRTVARH